MNAMQIQVICPKFELTLMTNVVHKRVALVLNMRQVEGL